MRILIYTRHALLLCLFAVPGLAVADTLLPNTISTSGDSLPSAALNQISSGPFEFATVARGPATIPSALTNADIFVRFGTAPGVDAENSVRGAKFAPDSAPVSGQIVGSLAGIPANSPNAGICFDGLTCSATPVPEPATATLMGLGIASILVVRGLRRQFWREGR